jgi:hypothetical protein
MLERKRAAQDSNRVAAREVGLRRRPRARSDCLPLSSGCWLRGQTPAATGAAACRLMKTRRRWTCDVVGRFHPDGGQVGLREPFRSDGHDYGVRGDGVRTVPRATPRTENAARSLLVSDGRSIAFFADGKFEANRLCSGGTVQGRWPTQPLGDGGTCGNRGRRRDPVRPESFFRRCYGYSLRRARYTGPDVPNFSAMQGHPVTYRIRNSCLTAPHFVVASQRRGAGVVEVYGGALDGSPPRHLFDTDAASAGPIAAGVAVLHTTWDTLRHSDSNSVDADLRRLSRSVGEGVRRMSPPPRPPQHPLRPCLYRRRGFRGHEANA